MANDNTRSGSPLLKLIVLGIVGIAVVVVFFQLFSVTIIHGNELGVKETWSGGVSPEVFQPKTYFLTPGQHIIAYDASSKVFVMNDKTPSGGEKGTGREKDAYLVQSLEGQEMHISLNLRWHLDPTKLIQIHKTVRQDIEDKLIRPVVMRVVKDEATRMKAMDAYSGTGLVDLQKSIENALAGNDATESKELRERGVVVENFVIEHIRLDDKYLDEIKGKQIATLKAQRSAMEQTAADAQALVAKSLAQADYNKQVVEAERDAKMKVTAATASSEQAVIAAKAAASAAVAQAEASQKTQVLEAEGKKMAMIATAEGTLAMGKAEAQAKELLLRAWAVPGADSFVKVEVSKQLGTAFSNIKGYLPSDMKVNLMTDNFVKAVDTMTGNPMPLVQSKQ